MTSNKKKERIKRAVAMKYGKNMTQKEIADELGVTRVTVARYLSSDIAEEYISPYDRKSEYEIRKMLEDRLTEYIELEERIKREVLENPEISGDKKTKLLREFRNGTKDLVEVLDDVGVFEKAPDRHEVEHKGGVDVLDRLREYAEDDND